MPRFSLLMPTRNRPAMILEAIGALLQQDFEDWELLVKDGGSSIVHLLPKDRRIKYEHCPEHPCRANKALAEATGDIINFCADDDWMLPGTLSAVSEAIGSSMWLYGQIRFCGPGTGWIMGDHWDYERLKRENFVPCPATFWLREASDIIGPFNPDLISGDYEYWLRLGARWKPVFLPRVLVNYRVHPDQDSNRVRERMAADHRLIVERAAAGAYAA